MVVAYYEKKFYVLHFVRLYNRGGNGIKYGGKTNIFEIIGPARCLYKRFHNGQSECHLFPAHVHGENRHRETGLFNRTGVHTHTQHWHCHTGQRI